MLDQIRKKSFWMTGLSIAILLLAIGVYQITTMWYSQNNEIAALYSELNETGFDEVAKIYKSCNLGAYRDREIYTLEGCKLFALESDQAQESLRSVERIFQKYNL